MGNTDVKPVLFVPFGGEGGEGEEESGPAVTIGISPLAEMGEGAQLASASWGPGGVPVSRNGGRGSAGIRQLGSGSPRPRNGRRELRLHPHVGNRFLDKNAKFQPSATRSRGRISG